MIDRSPTQTRAVLTYLFGDDDPEKLARTFGAELQRIAVTKPDVMLSTLNHVDQHLPRSVLDEETAQNFSSKMGGAMSK